MRVIIVGAGQVGESIAADLSDAHDVVIVEQDPDRVEEINYNLDVLAVEGDGTSVSTLEEADVADADMVIASTDDDETNIVVCSTAKAVSDAFTIARVKNTEYLRTWRRSRSAFGIDFMVCTYLLAAESIVRVVGLPAARDADTFADGRVEMAEFDVGEESPLAGQTVAEADTYDSLTFAAVVRGEEMLIPTGSTELRADDRLIVIGTPRSVRAFAGDVAPDETALSGEVVIIGGSEIGYHVARLLADRGVDARLLEQDPERARQLAEELPETIVMETDATDIEFLEREHIGDAEVVVAALDSDEKNLLASLLSERVGTDRSVAVIDQSEYVDLFEAVGVDVGVNPREVVAEEITRFTRAGGAENVALVESGRAEVLEIEVSPDSPLVGEPIRESIRSLPDDVVIGAITRGGEYIVPRGETVIEAGDHVVLFAAIEHAETVASML
ncbi:Trk system potassium transporter TrkA [Halolamina salifodinae]|uniref:Trk system potassium uptake protein TrkA n=1 Tax=Halolamina salifodinae TaxID=1202767 RepID=A0A8T4GU07_9EURY|nr:Trk system potassium transporter TrkA [Halolamina salifodinae]MBP1986571.1 trk system potassium uptake protein TrkA [Halolamina salifodinae]